MIGYVLLGTNDFARACRFYDELLAAYGAKRGVESDRMVMWYSAKPGRPGLGVVKPHDGQPASAGNGSMIALALDSTEKVDAMYRKALELGASDEGAPGKRTPTFYGAYFRDLDGNKLCVFSMVRN